MQFFVCPQFWLFLFRLFFVDISKINPIMQLHSIFIRSNFKLNQIKCISGNNALITWSLSMHRLKSAIFCVIQFKMSRNCTKKNCFLCLCLFWSWNKAEKIYKRIFFAGTPNSLKRSVYCECTAEYRINAVYTTNKE